MIYDPLIELPVFLAYSLELERESAERLREFSAIMEAHNQRGLAATFNELASYSDKHAAEVETICRNRSLPGIRAWEFDWPDNEPPETYQYNGVSYEMSTRQALETMLAQERESAAFYQDVADRTPVSDIRGYALAFAEEEREHARALELWLAKVPVDNENMPDIDSPREID